MAGMRCVEGVCHQIIRSNRQTKWEKLSKQMQYSYLFPHKIQASRPCLAGRGWEGEGAARLQRPELGYICSCGAVTCIDI